MALSAVILHAGAGVQYIGGSAPVECNEKSQMPSAEHNEDLVRNFFAVLSTGDLEKIRAARVYGQRLREVGRLRP